MALCDLCQGFDIRALLLKSVAQKPEATGMTDRNHADADDYRPPIPFSYPHHESIVALRKSAENGCDLCNLFWLAWVKKLNKRDFTDEWLERIFQGHVYIGCSGWVVSRQGLPYVELTQKISGDRSRTLCSFEAFANRGIEDLPIIMFMDNT